MFMPGQCFQQPKPRPNFFVYGSQVVASGAGRQAHYVVLVV